MDISGLVKSYFSPELQSSAFADAYKGKSSSEIISMAGKNLKSMAEAGKHGQGLHFENGEIAAEGKSLQRTFGSHEYRDIKHLDIFFEKLNEAVNSSKDLKELIALGEELAPAQEGLIALKSTYEKKYTQPETFAIYKQSIENGLNSLAQIKSRILRAITESKTKEEFNELNNNIAQSLEKLQRSQSELETFSALKWNEDTGIDKKAWNSFKLGEIRKLAAVFNEHKQELQDAILKKKSFSAKIEHS